MDNRRDFLKKALLLAGTTGLANTIPPAIQRALAIEPIAGSTFMDAEHVVILMQENRSFDHAFGTLKGVRGFNDPRFVRLPNGNPVWFQSDQQSHTYAPFRLDIHGSKATWMGAVPHSRHSQVDAFNEGKHDNWIEAKRKAKPYENIPLTMGYHNREDIPFNYALADAFTICDQNFCSGMTSTWPNRLFFWTGTIREKPDTKSRAWIRNDLPVGQGRWKTFPERLEEAGIAWKVYQNDLTCGGGFVGEERSWLSNFGCNPLELFEQYHVKFSPRYVKTLKGQIEGLPSEIKTLRDKLETLDPASKAYTKTQTAIQKKEEVLQKARGEVNRWTAEYFDSLSEREKNLFNKAFTTNKEDPDYHQLDTLSYVDDQGKEQELTVPKGDVLHQFRADVERGQLPAVSWMVPAEKYSDHPTAPWYGSWYVSEIMDILTKNPEVWKKTILIMTYDENDGYFDHIPPFIPPNPYVKNSGKCSEGIDTSIEYTLLAQEVSEGISEKEARGAAIGLGFRVPLIIASPWSRGGKVCSQVFDHTSTLQFLETWLSHKFETTIREENISDWRRTVCGNLTAAFSKAADQKDMLPFLERNSYLEGIHQAQFKEVPKGFGPLPQKEVELAKEKPHVLPFMPQQEAGIKESCGLPYELYVDGELQGELLHLKMIAGKEVHGAESAGSPFTVYEAAGIRSYAVAAGNNLSDSFSWPRNKRNKVELHGPNGFYRCFQNKGKAPALKIRAFYEPEHKKFTGNLVIWIENTGDKELAIRIIDNAYGKAPISEHLKAQEKKISTIRLKDSAHWYDLSIQVEGYPDFLWSYAGRVETGESSFADPQLNQPGSLRK